MSFEAEILLARLRARGSKLAGPILLLCLSAFLLSFLSSRATQQWQSIWLEVGCGLIAFFGFAIPAIRYLTAWTDITTSRVLVRSGLFGQRFREISMANIERVELTGSRLITIYIPGEEPMVLRGLPKAKMVAQEISQLTAKFSLGAK